MRFQETQWDENVPRYKANYDTRPSRDLSFHYILVIALMPLRLIYIKLNEKLDG